MDRLPLDIKHAIVAAADADSYDADSHTALRVWSLVDRDFSTAARPLIWRSVWLSAGFSRPQHIQNLVCLLPEVNRHIKQVSVDIWSTGDDRTRSLVSVAAIMALFPRFSHLQSVTIMAYGRMTSEEDAYLEHVLCAVQLLPAGSLKQFRLSYGSEELSPQVCEVLSATLRYHREGLIDIDLDCEGVASIDMDVLYDAPRLARLSVSGYWYKRITSQTEVRTLPSLRQICIVGDRNDTQAFSTYIVPHAPNLERLVIQPSTIIPPTATTYSFIEEFGLPSFPRLTHLHSVNISFPIRHCFPTLRNSGVQHLLLSAQEGRLIEGALEPVMEPGILDDPTFMPHLKTVEIEENKDGLSLKEWAEVQRLREMMARRGVVVSVRKAMRPGQRHRDRLFQDGPEVERLELEAPLPRRIKTV